MANVFRHSYTEKNPSLGAASFQPVLPISLANRAHSIDTAALLGTGSPINVLPYELGLQLGAEWKEQTTELSLIGNLASSKARALIVSGVVGEFEPVRLAFAWADTNDVPVLFGQVNFFLEFDVCFFRSQLYFEVRLKSNG